MCIHIYTHTHIHTHTYIHACTKGGLAADVDDSAARQGQPLAGTVSFHDFKSQNFKSSVSNPKSKYVACLSVLSQISDCQGLGRKNKHEILKTDCSRAKLMIRVV